MVAYTRWPDSRKWVLPLCAVFLVIDVAFLIANGAKLFSGIGAWVPLFIGIAAFTADAHLAPRPRAAACGSAARKASSSTASCPA